jgi:hypothetical protein
MLTAKPSGGDPDAHERVGEVSAAVSKLKVLPGMLGTEPNADIEAETYSCRRPGLRVEADGAHLGDVLRGRCVGRRAHTSRVP